MNLICLVAVDNLADAENLTAAEVAEQKKREAAADEEKKREAAKLNETNQLTPAVQAIEP